MTEAELEKVLELAEKATPGPWGLEQCWVIVISDEEYPDIVANFQDTSFVPEESKMNAEFVAASRTLVPELAKECLRLREALQSIAFINCSGPESPYFWLLKKHSDCAEVLATDVMIAREALEGK